MRKPDRLYHFTCADGHQQIERTGTLRPQTAMWPFVWLTSEADPDFEASGLRGFDGFTILDCDRTDYRYVVTDLTTCRPWLGSPERPRVSARFLQLLEQFGDPQHWWITTEPVTCELDGSYRKPVTA